ncbi:MAG: tyrosine-type recombinase/integrase [Actinomycetota bacterium]
MGHPDTMNVIVAWENTLEAEGLSERTLNLYTYGVWRFLRQHVRGPITNATEDHVISFLRSIGKQSEAKRKYLTALRSVFAYCVCRSIVRHDPTAEIRIRRGRHRRRQRALEPEQLYLIWCHAFERDPKRAYAMMAAFGLGTRRMELANLSPNEVRFGSGEVELLHCKGGKTRTTPMSPVARAGLELLRPWYNGTVLGGIREQTLTAWFKQAAKDAGLYHLVRGRPTHIFRATYATYLLDSGESPATVRDLLGHENIATTDAYFDALDRRKKQAAAGLRIPL